MTLRLRGFVALKYHDVGLGRGQSQFFCTLVAGRPVKSEGGRIARKFDNNYARAKLPFDLLRLPAACEECPAKFAKRCGECLSVFLIGSHVTYIDGSSPVAFCHLSHSPLELSR